MTLLDIHDHSRDSAGLLHVYPVISRRAGGVSVGINLNTNNACNWHCIYCQVPNLTRGGPPPIDLHRLESELRGFLHDVLRGGFMAEKVPEGMRHLVDVAFSGNGEPTSAREFPAAVDCVARVLHEEGLELPVRLITNGSLVDRENVQQGLRRMAGCAGEVWFKVDAGSSERTNVVNGVRLNPQTVARRLALCAGLCPTWVQTCVFAVEGAGPSDEDILAYLNVLRLVGPERLRGVLLYGLARPSLQDGGEGLSALPLSRMEDIADRIQRSGLCVSLSP